MAPRATLLVLLALLSVVTASSYCQHREPVAPLAAAPGVEYRLLLGGLGRPRGLVEDGEGNLLVVEGKGVTRVVLDGDCVASKRQLIGDDKLNHGIALSKDGRTLLASSSSDIYAWSYDAARGKVGQRRHVVTGMKQGGHATRTLLVPALNPDQLLVSRGSDGNVDKDTTHIASGRSQIRVFKLDDLLAAEYPVPYASGDVLGWGLRNSVGVAQDPTTGNIWSVENSLDEMKRRGKDIHETNPGEELNFHGRPDDVYGDVYGRNFGYPACVTMYDADEVDDYPGRAETGRPMVGDHMGRNWTDEWCQRETLAPCITFQAHLAPLGLEFQDDGRAAYISMHGSWNRKNAIGYRLSRVAFADGAPVHGQDSRDAEEKVLWNEDESRCPYKCFRPVGLAMSRSGERLFVTSDATGELFAVTGFKGEYGRSRPREGLY